MRSKPRPPVGVERRVEVAAGRDGRARARRPATRRSSLPASLPAVPVTSRPAASANWTVARPTPPLAPWTSTRLAGDGAAARWKQRAVRGGVGHAERRALRVREVVRQRVHVLRAAQRVLGVGPAERARHVDALARLSTRTPAPSTPGVYGQRRQLAVEARSHVRLVGVHSGRLHADEDLALDGLAVAADSSSRRTSGSPNSCTRMARMAFRSGGTGERVMLPGAPRGGRCGGPRGARRPPGGAPPSRCRPSFARRQGGPCT